MENFDEYTKNTTYRVRSVEGKYYIFGNHKCFELNELGAIVWKYIEEEISVEDFCKRVIRKYKDCTYEGVFEDLNKFIEFLVLEGMIDERRCTE